VDQTKQGQKGRTLSTADTWQQQHSKQASKEGIKSGVHRGTLRKRREEAEINTVIPKTKTKLEAVDRYLFIFIEHRFFLKPPKCTNHHLFISLEPKDMLPTELSP
jgi:hypothetical protein